MISSQNLSKAKILIVDDQAANVRLLHLILQEAGYLCISSTQNPLEVSALHLQNSYDLILLDLQMPVMNGFQVMEELKSIETGGYLPVIVITAQPNEKLKALKAGGKDFIGKPFEIAEVLARVHNLLEVRLLNLETQKLYKQVMEEKKFSDRLLHNVLPSSLVERLKGKPELMENDLTPLIVDSFPDVTVLFADIVGFTNFSKGVSPEILVRVLNNIFTRFDALAQEWCLEKIKTIGDFYMAASGLPIANSDHAFKAANMALNMIKGIASFNEEYQYNLNLRIGISTGAVVAGVIGKQKFLYDLWGDVVNTASRMESHGVPGRIQITDSTRERLKDNFDMEERGPIEVKGIGKLHTWFLNNRKM